EQSKMIILILMLTAICSSVQNPAQFLFRRHIESFNKTSKKEEIIELDNCSGISFLDEKTSLCENCQAGTINKELIDLDFNGCSDCILNYYYNKDKSECQICKNNKISSLRNFHKNENCNIENSFSLDSVLESGKSKKCSEIVANSIARDHKTPPLSIFCKCKIGMVKMLVEDFYGDFGYKAKCIESKLLKDIIDPKGLDYAVLTIYQKRINVFMYINCDPHREKYDILEYCLCPPGYIFHDFKCKLCVENEPEDKEKEHQCVRCPPNKHLSLDGKSCMCPYSYKPQSVECGEPKENDMHCTGNLALINGSCQLCRGKKIISKINGQCICPYSEKLLDNDCNECDIESSSGNKCKCGGNAEKFETKCQCKNHQILDCNNECIGCPKGYIRAITGPDACICPTGKVIKNNKCIDCSKGYIITNDNEVLCYCPVGSFINNDGECIQCHERKYSSINDSNECASCPIHKYTSKIGRESGVFCDIINVKRIIIFIQFIITIFLVVICIVLYIKIKTNCCKNHDQAIEETMEMDNRDLNEENESLRNEDNSTIRTNSKMIDDSDDNSEI
ncbi:MAG: hypothetical protein MHPSP_000611, partial [Paramarteilia canceri]